ncbi:hypothetical protein ACMD2_01614 [Ananas comosus]|uniref:Uncharacterized protein n=1 Tax=Ananas comosus TaxID=4615 RepID=A0A199VXN0_ANACO|nr:hypothetical protein ACMD2_01614 [Ananas comosus]
MASVCALPSSDASAAVKTEKMHRPRGTTISVINRKRPGATIGSALPFKGTEPAAAVVTATAGRLQSPYSAPISIAPSW